MAPSIHLSTFIHSVSDHGSPHPPLTSSSISSHEYKLLHQFLIMFDKPKFFLATSSLILYSYFNFGFSLDFHVVLDLDETLVCAYETSSLPAIVRNQAIDAGLNWFELECLSLDKESEGKPKINYVIVFERPGLHGFLTQLSLFADLILFTAGLEGYAKPLVDRIDAENRFSRRLYRPSTSSTEYREHVKDLSCISRNFCRIVIVDNNPFSFLLQPVNGIPCMPFSVGQPHDNQLLDVILPLLKQLSEQGDVRPLLYEKFHMPEWFHKHGIPNGWVGTHG
ncbi:hypothetical protein Lser_V15G36651 [Lactuca serriola]